MNEEEIRRELDEIQAALQLTATVARWRKSATHWFRIGLWSMIVAFVALAFTGWSVQHNWLLILPIVVFVVFSIIGIRDYRRSLHPQETLADIDKPPPTAVLDSYLDAWHARAERKQAEWRDRVDEATVAYEQASYDVWHHRATCADDRGCIAPDDAEWQRLTDIERQAFEDLNEATNVWRGSITEAIDDGYRHALFAMRLLGLDPNEHF